MSRLKSTVKKVIYLPKPFKVPDSSHTAENDIIPHQLWKIGSTYISVYGPLHQFGFVAKSGKAYLKNCSRLKLLVLKLSSLHMVASFVLLATLVLKKFYCDEPEEDQSSLDTLRKLALLYSFFFLPIMIPTSVMMAFRANSIVNIINTIVEFGNRIQGRCRKFKSLKFVGIYLVHTIWYLSI